MPETETERLASQTIGELYLAIRQREQTIEQLQAEIARLKGGKGCTGRLRDGTRCGQHVGDYHIVACPLANGPEAKVEACDT